MTSFRKLSFAFLTAGLALAFSVTVFGQDTGTTQQPTQPAPGTDGGRGGFRRGPGGRDGGGMRMFEQLNLSDTQKQQIQGILKTSGEATRPKQEEMFRLRQQSNQGTLSADDQAKLNQLSADLKASREKTNESINAILTPEQRTKLEELRQQRRSMGPRGEGRRPGPPPVQQNQVD